MVQSNLTFPPAIQTPGQNRVKIITGLKKTFVEFQIRIRILQLVMRHIKNPKRIVSILQELDHRRRHVLGNHAISKLVGIGKSYHWDLYTPAFPSLAFDHWMLAEINRITSIPGKTNLFTNVFFALTKKCSLKCEHCFEWDILNQREKLTTADLVSIQKSLQDAGTSQIQLTGGEPLMRAEEIKLLLKSSNRQTEYWILTSGHKLDLALANQLKADGLHGVLVSIDHHNEEEHNQFRGNKKSFYWAQKAIEAANRAGLTTGMTICVSREYVQHGHLEHYMELAKVAQVGFVQILEPKAVGHFTGKDVMLTTNETKLLDDFYLQYNYDKRFATYPIISYHGYHQRRAGCFASGNRNLYVDTDGDVNSCPFCKTKTGNLLDENIETLLPKLQQSGCAAFGKTKF
ncbi:MAG: radical SAM/SPASM domain-containing protein [Flavobacteriales bacterium]